MAKICLECDYPVWARKRCLQHDKIANPSKYQLKRESSLKPTKSKQIKPKIRKPTGELQLFLSIYSECEGICEITNKQIPFNVSSFMHILGKGSYPSLRLVRENIKFVDHRIHHLYDNEGKEKLLREFPEASIIYEMKDKLRANYYNV